MTGGAGNDEMRDAQFVADQPEAPKGEKYVVPGLPVVTEGQGKWRQSDVAGTWTAVTDKDYFGVGTVEIVNDSTMKFNYYRTTSGELYDTVTLQRDRSVVY